MHIADFAIGMLGANGIVAGGIAIVTGAGLAAKLEGKGGVAVSFFGDGAWNAGPFTNASTSPRPGNCRCSMCARTTCMRRIRRPPRPMRSPMWRRARPATASPGWWLTATMPWRFTRRQTAPSSARARAEGPTLIECKTYRWRAHTERRGQPDHRDRAELEAWQRRDPIARLERQLRDQGDFDEAGKAAMEREVAAAIEAAVAFAEASPFPLPEQASDDVFAA